jgi:hypothetical protein
MHHNCHLIQQVMVMIENNNDENNNIWRLPTMSVSTDGLIPAGNSTAAPDYGFIQSSRY